MRRSDLPGLETQAPRELNRAELEIVSGGRWWGFDPPPETNREFVERVLAQSGTGVKWPLGDDGVPLKQN
jgi:hypothetical protein